VAVSVDPPLSQRDIDLLKSFTVHAEGGRAAD